MLEILLMSLVLSPIVTAGLYTLFSGPGPARNTPRHHAHR
jgi:hypothetical protein